MPVLWGGPSNNLCLEGTLEKALGLGCFVLHHGKVLTGTPLRLLLRPHVPRVVAVFWSLRLHVTCFINVLYFPFRHGLPHCLMHGEKAVFFVFFLCSLFVHFCCMLSFS